MTESRPSMRERSGDSDRARNDTISPQRDDQWRRGPHRCASSRRSVTVTLNAATIIAGTSTTAAAVPHDAATMFSLVRAILELSDAASRPSTRHRRVTAVAAGTVDITAPARTSRVKLPLRPGASGLGKGDAARRQIITGRQHCGRRSRAMLTSRAFADRYLSRVSAAVATWMRPPAPSRRSAGTASISQRAKGSQASGSAGNPAVTSVTVSLNPATSSWVRRRQRLRSRAM